MVCIDPGGAVGVIASLAYRNLSIVMPWHCLGASNMVSEGAHLSVLQPYGIAARALLGALRRLLCAEHEFHMPPSLSGPWLVINCQGDRTKSLPKI